MGRVYSAGIGLLRPLLSCTQGAQRRAAPALIRHLSVPTPSVSGMVEVGYHRQIFHSSALISINQRQYFNILLFIFIKLWRYLNLHKIIVLLSQGPRYI